MTTTFDSTRRGFGPVVLETKTMNTETMTDLEKQVRMIATQIEYGFDSVEDDDSEDSPLMDWLEGVLGFQWIVSSDKETLLGARLLVAFGGPNIWVDTNRGIVEGYWWANSAFANFRTDTDNAYELHEYLEMIWNC